MWKCSKDWPIIGVELMVYKVEIIRVRVKMENILRLSMITNSIVILLANHRILVEALSTNFRNLKLISVMIYIGIMTQSRGLSCQIVAIS